MTAPQKLATPEEVAAWLDVSTWQVGQLRRTGRLVAVQVSPRIYRFAWPDVKAYAARCRR